MQLASLNADKDNLSGALTTVQEKWASINELASKLATLQGQLKEQLADLEAAYQTQAGTISGTRNQMNDLADVRKQLGEAQAKEIKQIDSKKLERINRMIQTDNDPHLVFILDNMARFMDGNEKASYHSTRDKFFASHQAFTEAVRKMDNSAMSKEFCEDLMKQITGGSSEGGAVAKALCAPDNLGKYVEFYPFFKALSKMVFLAVTMRKERNFTRKISSGMKQVDRLEAKVDMQRQQIRALDVHLVVRAEADRMFRDEEKFIKEKLERTEEQIAQYTEKQEKIVDEFFSALPQSE